jgi:hypothetical protein
LPTGAALILVLGVATMGGKRTFGLAYEEWQSSDLDQDIGAPPAASFCEY